MIARENITLDKNVKDDIAYAVAEVLQHDHKHVPLDAKNVRILSKDDAVSTETPLPTAFRIR